MCSYKTLQCLQNTQSCFPLVECLLNPEHELTKGRFYGLVSMLFGMQWHNLKYPFTGLFVDLRRNYVGLMVPV